MAPLESAGRPLLDVSAESEPHRRPESVLKVGFAARTETFVERSGQYRRGYGFVDGRLDRPASLAGVRYAAGEVIERRVLRKRRCREVEEPRRDDAAAPPQLGNVREIQI